MNIEQLYNSIATNGEQAARNKELLLQTHWFNSNADFDPRSGLALISELNPFLRRLNEEESSKVIKDRLWKIVEHSKGSVKRLIRSLNEAPMRRHSNVPIGKVKELDANSFIKLSNRPGCSIRQKCATKPYIEAPEHYLSIDLPENQLLKAYALRIIELLVCKAACLHEEEDELVLILMKWLHSDVASEISRWKNLPPNNTLLSHRDYRRVWDSWRWLISLEADLNRDISDFESRKHLIEFWQKIAEVRSKMETNFAELPVLFNYEEFDVRPWQNLDLQIYCKNPYSISFKSTSIPIPSGKGKKVFEQNTISEPVCIDLSKIRPYYAIYEDKIEQFPQNLLIQYWKNDKDSTYIDLRYADSIWLHENAREYVSSSDYFLNEDSISKMNLDAVASNFVDNIAETFTNPDLVWLIPDNLSDFELGIIRRNINRKFSKAEPLPRSIAAVMQRIDYSDLIEGQAYAVVDYNGSSRIVTKLFARYSSELKKQNPATYGFYWERHPCQVETISSFDREKALNQEINIFKKNEWFLKKDSLIVREKIDEKKLISDYRLGKVESIIEIDKSPVKGGIVLLQLKKKADAIYWKDCLPELSTKIPLNGYYQHFYFVDKNIQVVPKRNKKTDIEINKYFELSKGVDCYKFPLYQGEGQSAIRYIATLVSKDFPLMEDVTCSLRMEYRYGADNPYTLIFEPTNGMKPIEVQWQEADTVGVEDISKLPVPEFPASKTWNDFEVYPLKDNNGTWDLLGWIKRKLSSLEKCGRGDSSDENILETLKKTRFQFITVWNNGHSVGEYDAPNDFRLFILNASITVERILASPNVKQKLKDEIIYLFSCLHKDTPPAVYNSLKKSINCLENMNFYKFLHIGKQYAFAIGDASLEWQNDLLKVTIKKIIQQEDLNKLSNCLMTFAVALWRNQSLINKLDFKSVKLICEKLVLYFDNSLKKEDKDNIYFNKKENGYRLSIDLTATIEIMLAFIRLRKSSDQCIRELLVPGNNLSRKFVELVDKITELLIKNNAGISKRIVFQMNQPKPKSLAKTEDILYALRLYLTNDSGANSISVKEVNDN